MGLLELLIRELQIVYIVVLSKKKYFKILASLPTNIEVLDTIQDVLL